jgi:hypothetical protein
MISTTAHSGKWHMKPVWCGEMEEIVATLNIKNPVDQFLLDGKGIALMSGGKYSDTYTVVYGDTANDTWAVVEVSEYDACVLVFGSGLNFTPPVLSLDDVR